MMDCGGKVCGMFYVGIAIDLPFNVAIDTILLPFDIDYRGDRNTVARKRKKNTVDALYYRIQNSGVIK